MADAPDRVPVEREQHRLAFEQYYAFGAGRSYRQAAEKLGVSASTIKLWSRTFLWRERIQERDAEAARQIADRSSQSTFEERERDLRIVRMAKMKLTRDIAEGKVRGKIPDLDLLIRLEAYLAGSLEDRLTWIDRETDPEKLRARLREIAAAACGESLDSARDKSSRTALSPDGPLAVGDLSRAPSSEAELPPGKTPVVRSAAADSPQDESGETPDE